MVAVRRPPDPPPLGIRVVSWQERRTGDDVVEYAPRGAAYRLFDPDDRASTAPEVLIEGPAGTGKTLACLWNIHNNALLYAGMHGLILRKEQTVLTRTALVTYRQRVLGSSPNKFGVKFFGGNKEESAGYKYPNTSKIDVLGLDDPDKVLSSEFDQIYVNEGIQLTEYEINELTGRLRNGVMPYQQLLIDCNPGPVSHWLNKRFPPADMPTERRVRLLSRHQDNPHYWSWRAKDWTEAGRQYVVGTLGSMTGVQRDRLFEGQWATVEGAVYSQFDRARHVKRVDTTGWRVLLPCDIGSRNPTAILTMHVNGAGYVHISHELYQRDMSASDIVGAITRRADIVDPEFITIDISATGIIEDVERLGYPVVTLAKPDRDVVYGIQRVQSLIAEDKLTVDPDCVETINEFESYRYHDGARATNTDKPKEEHNHALDALRYGVMAASIEPVRVEIW